MSPGVDAEISTTTATALAAHPPQMGGPAGAPAPPARALSSASVSMNPLSKPAYRPTLNPGTDDARQKQQQALRYDFHQTARVGLKVATGLSNWKKKVRVSRGEALGTVTETGDEGATAALKLAVPETTDSATSPPKDGPADGAFSVSTSLACAPMPPTMPPPSWHALSSAPPTSPDAPPPLSLQGGRAMGKPPKASNGSPRDMPQAPLPPLPAGNTEGAAPSPEDPKVNASDAEVEEGSPGSRRTLPRLCASPVSTLPTPPRRRPLCSTAQPQGGRSCKPPTQPSGRPGGRGGSSEPSPQPSGPQGRRPGSVQVRCSPRTHAHCPSAPGPTPAPLRCRSDDDDDEASGICGKILVILGMPYTWLFRFTVPDCRTERFKKWFMATFVMSILWIGVLSYFMLRFSKRAGCIMKIPEVVMGMVVISAGTSVPDALASIFVAKNGQGDMAVSNVLGSNVFNIFLGLGLPWLIYSAKEGGEAVTSAALQGDIVQPIIILFIYIGLLLAAMVITKWKLHPKLGYVLIALHGLFLLWVLLTSELGSGDPVFTVGR